MMTVGPLLRGPRGGRKGVMLLSSAIITVGSSHENYVLFVSPLKLATPIMPYSLSLIPFISYELSGHVG